MILKVWCGTVTGDTRHFIPWCLYKSSVTYILLVEKCWFWEVMFSSNCWHPWLWQEVEVVIPRPFRLNCTQCVGITVGTSPCSPLLVLPVIMLSAWVLLSVSIALSFVLVSFLCGFKYINKCVFCIGHLLLQSWFWDSDPTSVPANPYSVWRYHWCYIHKFPPVRAT